MSGRLRNEPCPCGSRKKAKKCCLRSGRWDRPAIPIDLNPDRTAAKHARCYLARFGGCSSQLSREHYVSNAILTSMEAEADNGLVQVSGAPWTNEGEFKSLPAGSLAARILCTSHNRRLSALDAQAGQLWDAIRRMTSAEDLDGGRVLLNGHDIERWALKYVCGQLLAGGARCSDGTRVDEGWFPDWQLQMIADESAWNTGRGCGLFFLSSGRRIEHRPELRFTPVVSQQRATVLSVRFGLCGLDFLVVFVPHVRQDYPPGFVRRYRPAGFCFRVGDVASELLLSWNDTAHHNLITFESGGLIPPAEPQGKEP